MRTVYVDVSDGAVLVNRGSNSGPADCAIGISRQDQRSDEPEPFREVHLTKEQLIELRNVINQAIEE